MNTQQTTSTIIYLIYLIPVMYLGFKAYKKTTSLENFLVSDWNIPFPLLVGTLTAALGTAAYFLAALSMGYAEKGAFEGMSTTVGLGACLLLAGVFWAAPLRRMHGWSMADYYGLRFASKGLGTYCGVIMAVGTALFMVGGMCVAGGYLLSAITGISFEMSVVIYAIIVGSYCIAGGLWAVTYTDTLQVVLLIVGEIIILYLLMDKAGSISPGALFSPEYWDVGHLFTHKGSLFWFLFLSIAVGDIPACDMGQRACGGLTPRITKKAFIIAGSILIVLGLIPAFAAEALLTIYPGFEGNPELLWTKFILEYTSPLAAGVLLVLFIAAGMSTLSASYVSSAAMLIKNLGMDNRGLRLNERQMLNLARIIVLCIVVISILMALFFANALVLAYATFEVIFVSLTWPVVLGPYWKRLSAKANWIAITLGLAVYIISTISFTDTGNVGGVIESIIAKSETLPGILGMIVGLYAFPVFWGATISLILTIVCAFIFEPSKEELIAFELQRTNVNDDVEGYPEYERETEYEWQGVHMSKKLREEYLKPGADFKELALNYYAGVENNLEKRTNSRKA